MLVFLKLAWTVISGDFIFSNYLIAPFGVVGAFILLCSIAFFDSISNFWLMQLSKFEFWIPLFYISDPILMSDAEPGSFKPLSDLWFWFYLFCN